MRPATAQVEGEPRPIEAVSPARLSNAVGTGKSPEITVESKGTTGTARLLLVVGENHLGTYRLTQGHTLVIGREQTCDVPLLHPKISRRHAHIHVGEVLAVEDLGSTNGTRLSGRRLRRGERVVLEVGKNLQLGPFVAVLVEPTATTGEDGAARAAIPIADPTPKGVPDVVSRIAQGLVSVLITGETGAGKDVLARTVHELSRRTGQFVAINCASMSESLLESELFGHERGSFTGAGAAKPGLFEVAAGGTVFLDEIGELPASLQARLLRALESRTVYRVGGVKPVSLDVRFVAATHRNLEDEVAAGRFRQDLYFRVNGIVLAIKPLRARRDDIQALAESFLARATPAGRTPPRLTAAAISALINHDWPGNVRELRTVMERALVVCEEDEVGPAHIMFDKPGVRPGAPAPPPRDPRPAEPGAALGTDDESRQRERLVAALAACGGNQTKAARVLGVSRTTLVNMLAIHRLPRPRKAK